MTRPAAGSEAVAVTLHAVPEIAAHARAPITTAAPISFMFSSGGACPRRDPIDVLRISRIAVHSCAAMLAQRLARREARGLAYPGRGWRPSSRPAWAGWPEARIQLTARLQLPARPTNNVRACPAGP